MGWLSVVGIATGILGINQSRKAGKTADQAAYNAEQAGIWNEKIAETEVEVAETEILLAELGVDVAELERFDAKLRNKVAAHQNDYNAKISLVNADIASEYADRVRSVGKFEADKQRNTGERIAASQEVAFAANGIVADTGSARLVADDTLDRSNIDAAIIDFNHELEAHKHDVNAYNKRAEAARFAFAGDVARAQGVIDDAGALLNIEGAEYGVEGAILAKEGAEYAVKGAKYGSRAATLQSKANRYNQSVNTLSLLGSTATHAYNAWQGFS